MKETLIIAGFGGQGVLSMGKILAYSGVMQDFEVTWMPSYGPEMRGGTANCSVTVSDEPVGSPIVDVPDVLIAMNLPSLDKYENTVAVGGKIFVDSTLISRKVERNDVDVYYIPATQLASDNGLTTLANMIIMGKVLKETNGFGENVRDALSKVVSAKHADMLDFNLKALELGKNFE